MDGSSITCSPMLQNDNYPYWKTRMKDYNIKSIDKSAWCSILTGRQAPTIDFDAIKVPKVEVEWTTEEDRVSNANSKVLYAIFCGIDIQESKRISKFETLVRQAFEMTSDIYAKLCDLFSKAFTLGEK